MEMKSAIRRRKSGDTATNNGHAAPATSVRCQHCNRAFATISAEGGLYPSVPHEQACASCEPFLGLYDTLRTREQEHTALLERGPKHHGRILAHEQFRKARVALENFLVSTEAPNNASFDVAQAGFANRTEPGFLQCAQELGDVPDLGDDLGILDGASPPGEQATSSAPSPTTKRKRAPTSRISTAERKRIKFGEDVEERPEYRGSLEYYRGAKEYVPGRYAVTEGSEYEDTSGSTISFTKFTGQKKVGSKFVDITPKEQEYNGKAAPSAVRKFPRGGGRKDLHELSKLDLLKEEKNESQVYSRELRLSRRARSTTPPVAAKPRRASAESEAEADTSEEAAEDTPTSIVSLKVPPLPKAYAGVHGDMSSPILQHTVDTPRTFGDTGSNKAAIRATGSAVVRGVLSNIERELTCLQQAVVSPKHVVMVSKAVHGCQEALEPLKQIDHTNPTAEADSPQDEDDSIYFEASDGTGGGVPELQRNDPSNVDEVIPKWSEVIAHTQGSDEPDASVALNANALDDTPMEDKQNLSGALDLEQTENKKITNAGLPAHFTGSHGEGANQTQVERPTTVWSRSGNRSSMFPVATQSHTPYSGYSASRRQSGRTNSTAPSVDRSPEDELNKAPARPSTTKSQKPRVAFSRSSPASSLPAAADPREWKQLGAITGGSNERISDEPCTLELDGNENTGEDPPGEAVVVQAGYPGTCTAGIDASQHSSHTADQDPVTLLEAMLDASLVQPLQSEAQCEVAESMDSSFGELIDTRDEQQDTHMKIESETHSKAPLFVNNRDLDVATVGETGQESEVDNTDTDRHGAGEEAQVDPQTAHESAEVTTTETCSADRSFQNTIDTSNAELQDAVGSSTGLENATGDHDDTNIKSVVHLPRDQQSVASQLDQKSLLDLIGAERSERGNANRSHGRSGAEEASSQQHG